MTRLDWTLQSSFAEDSVQTERIDQGRLPLPRIAWWKILVEVPLTKLLASFIKPRLFRRFYWLQNITLFVPDSTTTKMSFTSSSASPAASSPTSSVGSTKPAVLLIGGVTHVQKEWEECSSFAELKVCPLRHRWLNSRDILELTGLWSKTFTGTTRAEFLEKCVDGSYSDVVALYRSNESTSVSTQIKHLNEDSLTDMTTVNRAIWRGACGQTATEPEAYLP